MQPEAMQPEALAQMRGRVVISSTIGNALEWFDFTVFGLDVNFGLGFGLTEASDKIVTKLIIGRAF